MEKYVICKGKNQPRFFKGFVNNSRYGDEIWTLNINEAYIFDKPDDLGRVYYDQIGYIKLDGEEVLLEVAVAVTYEITVIG